MRCPFATERRSGSGMAAAAAAAAGRTDNSSSRWQVRSGPHWSGLGSHSCHYYWLESHRYHDEDESWDEETGTYENSRCGGHHQEGDA